MDLKTLLDFSDDDFAAFLDDPACRLDPGWVNAFKASAEQASDEGDCAAALKLLDRAAQIAGRLADPLAEGPVWRGRANVLQRYNRFEDSLQASQRAVEIYAAQGLEMEVAKSRTIEVYTLGVSGRYDEAVALAGWLTDQFQALPVGQAHVASNLAQILTEAGRLAQAMEHYQRAYRLYQELNLPDKAARVLHNLGVCAEKMDDLSAAERDYRAAYPLLVENDDLIYSLKDLFNLALLYIRQERFDRALDCLADSRDGLAKLNDPGDLGYVHFFEARVRRALGQDDQALHLLQAAAAEFDRRGFEPDRVEVFLATAHLLTAREDQVGRMAGLAALEQATRMLAQIQVPALAAQVLLEKGELQLQLGQVGQAMESIAAAIFELERFDLPLRLAWGEAALADCLVEIRPEQAQEHYLRSLAQNQDRIPWLTVRCHYGLARLASGQSDWAVAEENYRAALANVSLVRQKIAGHAGQAGYGAGYAPVEAGLLGVLQRQNGRVADLFYCVEGVKARALATLLANNSHDLQVDDPLKALLQERLDAQRNFDRLVGAVLELPSGQASGLNHQRAILQAHDAGLTTQVEEARRRLQAINERIQRSSHPALTWREAVLPEIAATLALLPDCIYVSYYTTGGQWFALTSYNGAIEQHDLHVSVATIEHHLKSARAAIERLVDPRRLQQRLAILYDDLIAPIEGRLKSGSRLVISPAGDLWQLPFAALYSSRSGRYLVQDWTIHLIPNLAILALCRSHPRPSLPPLLVGYAGIPGRQGYLEGVETEIAELQALFPEAQILRGDNARAESIFHVGQNRAIVHLASHAWYDAQHPLESGLPLAGGEWLRAQDLYLHANHFAGSTIVVSGCESGLGKQVGGDNLGLNSAFLYAGAAGIISSLWHVNDAATTGLMKLLYAEVLVGKSTADALRQAQLVYLKSTDYFHPYYWSAFQWTGVVV